MRRINLINPENLEEDNKKSKLTLESFSPVKYISLTPLITLTAARPITNLKDLVINLLILVGLFFFAAYLIYLKRKRDPEWRSDYRFTEMVLPTDKEIYVLGTAVPTKKNYPEATQKGIVKKTKEHDTLLISNKKEREVLESRKHLSKYLLGAITIILIIAFLGAPILLAFNLGLEQNPSNIMMAIMIVFILLISFSAYVIFKKYIYKGFKFAGLKEKIKSLPTSEVGSMSMGLVELKGKPKPMGKPFKSPLTGQECAGYIYKIERSKKKGQWITKEKGRKTPIFYLDDGTGKIPIDPTNIKMERENLDLATFQKTVKKPEELPYPASKYLKRYLDQGFFQWLLGSFK